MKVCQPIYATVHAEVALHVQEEGLTIEGRHHLLFNALDVHDERGIAESLYIHTLTTCEGGHIFERNITTLENGNHKPAIHFVRVTRQKLMLWIGPYSKADVKYHIMLNF